LRVQAQSAAGASLPDDARAARLCSHLARGGAGPVSWPTNLPGVEMDHFAALAS
jgi:hypothetical protein